LKEKRYNNMMKISLNEKCKLRKAFIREMLTITNSMYDEYYFDMEAGEISIENFQNTNRLVVDDSDYNILYAYKIHPFVCLLFSENRSSKTDNLFKLSIVYNEVAFKMSLKAIYLQNIVLNNKSFIEADIRNYISDRFFINCTFDIIKNNSVKTNNSVDNTLINMQAALWPLDTIDIKATMKMVKTICNYYQYNTTYKNVQICIKSIVEDNNHSIIICDYCFYKFQMLYDANNLSILDEISTHIIDRSNMSIIRENSNSLIFEVELDK